MEAREFILHIQSRPCLKGGALSPNTVNNRVRALRAFFAWLNRKGYNEDHVLKDLRPPKMVKKAIEPLTPEEIKRMFATVNANTAMGARNTALYSLMLDTGLRLSEVAHLEEVGVRIYERYVKVLGKGSKERIVAFGVACQRSLLHYYHHFRPGQRVDHCGNCCPAHNRSRECDISCPRYLGSLATPTGP
jgi:site-specific recombinase XerD